MAGHADSSCQSDFLPTGFAARPYQRRIIEKVVGLFRGTARDAKGVTEPQVSSVLVESPTGSGKTIMGLAIARWMQQNLGYRVGWTAMRRNLLAQAAAENQRGFGVDVQPISMFEKHPPQVDLLIIDEAQHDGALSMANLHSCIKPKNILGLSATPFRSDRFKLCFERSIRDAGTHALIQEGYLSPYHHYTIPRYAPAEVAESYARDWQRWGRSLIFFHTMQDCRLCQRELSRRGIDAELVTAKSDRERQIADFSAGRVNVMISMMILAEGFDCPSLKTVFCRPSGRLCTVQMAGRALRMHPSLPFKQVVQCAQTRYPFPRGATPAEQYLWNDADGWRSLKLNRQIEAMSRRMQSLVAASSSQLPAMLTHQAAARTRPWWRQSEPSESVA